MSSTDTQTPTATNRSHARLGGKRPHRLACAAMCMCAIVLASVLPGSAAAATGAKCENEAIREQQGAAAMALPECRAYELVSPLGSAPERYGARAVASTNGDRFAYFSWNPYPGQESEGLFLLSSRTGSGWATASVTPPQGTLHESSDFGCNPSIFYSADLTSGVLADGFRQVEGEGSSPTEPLVCEGDSPALLEGEPRGVANLFLRNNETGQYEHLIDRTPVGGATAENAYLRAATPNLRHMVFSERAPLTPEAPTGRAENVYEWVEGSLHLVNFLPDGSPAEGELAGARPNLMHALSENGERVLFYNYEREELFVRVHAMREQSRVVSGECVELEKACTLPVDEAQPGAPGVGGGGIFVYASTDGSRVFFADEHRLTENATAEAEKPDLYEYDVETGKLKDLTEDPAEAADVIGFSGASEDASYLYFVAKGNLTGESSGAIPGQANLYVLHAGKIAFIATLEGGGTGFEGDELDWIHIDPRGLSSYRSQTLGTGGPTARAAPDGRFLAFTSVREITKVVNAPQQPNQCRFSLAGHCHEVFLYSAPKGTLVCLSCGKAGEAPTGQSEIPPPTGPLWHGPFVMSRNVMNDGRVFFDSGSALLPGASSETQNVYEFAGGRLYLIAAGGSTGPSEFLGASQEGRDVFFSTGRGLVRADTDSGASVYDAREQGGFLEPPEGGSGACENVETCRPPLIAPPGPVAPGSPLLAGAGNLHRPAASPNGGRAKGKVRGQHKLTRRQKLKRAVKRCRHKENGPRRRRCRRRARKRFGAHHHRARHSKHHRHHHHHHRRRMRNRAHKRGGVR